MVVSGQLHTLRDTAFTTLIKIKEYRPSLEAKSCLLNASYFTKPEGLLLYTQQLTSYSYSQLQNTAHVLPFYSILD
jgi:hypothetical protein